MATQAADVLRSVTAILQSGERREQFKVQTALSMMELAQRRRTQDITIASKHLEVASAANLQMMGDLASDFLSATGIGAYYEEAKEGKKKTKMVAASEDLVSDYGFSPSIANAAVSALWSYYEADSPRAIVKLAGNLGTAVQSGQDMSKGQAALIESFAQLQEKTQGIGDMKQIALQSLKTLENEFFIKKESMEFLNEDYKIQSDIGLYAGIKKPTEEFMTATEFMSTEQGMKALSSAIDAAKKDEDWDPSPGGTLALIGAAYGGQYIAPAARAEAAKYAEGARDYLKQLAKDLKHPAKGGLPSKKFKELYKTVKGPVWQRSPETMKRLLKAARSAGWSNTTSLSKAQAALTAIQESKFLSRTGKILTGAAYFAPLAGREIGEAVAGETGKVYGQTAGTAALTTKVLTNKVGDKTKMSFASYLARRIGKIGGKATLMAMADSPMVPFGDIAALGYTAYEIYNTYKAWQQYLDT